MSIKNYSDEELLSELILRNKPEQAPRNITISKSGKEAVIGIGKDHAAMILMHDDDILELKKICK